MLLIKRHYLKEFFKLFTIIGAGLALTFSLFDLIQKIDDFMPHRPSIGNMLFYALLKFPKNLLFLMPVGVLLSSLYTIGQASRAKEITAVMAAGGRVKNLLMPFIVTGVVLSFLGFALGEMVVPVCLKKAAELKRTIMKQTAAPSFFREGMMWLRAEDGSIVNIKLYVPDRDSFRGMSIFKMEKDRLKEIIQAEEAQYIPDTWVLKRVRRYNADSGEVTALEEFRYPHLGSPEVFRQKALGPGEMGIFELTGYAKRLKEAGIKNPGLTVEINSKVSYPLINLFMIVIGISLSAKRTMGGLVATAIGLLISLLYYFGYTMMLSLGYAGILPAPVAVWSVPVAFSAAAVYLYRKIPE